MGSALIGSRGRRPAFLGLVVTAIVAGMTVTAPASGMVAPESARVAPGSAPGGSCERRVLAAPARGDAAVRALGADIIAVAARNGTIPSELARHLRSDSNLWVDQCGDLFFQDELVADVDLSPTSEDDASWPSTVPAADAFRLHSRPGAERVVFLDFDGHFISGTSWNSLYTQDPWMAPAFSTDGDPASFSDAERNVIIEIWRRVAQDYAPFNVDVTTQDPGQDAITRSGSTDTRFGTRVLISPDATQAKCGCGGRAYVDVFDRTSNHEATQPAWVYPQALANRASNIAEAASHEAGHNLGLSHDGTQTASYYSGSGGWGPIMGSSYGQAITQWSNGSYPNANNTQDDIAIIAGNGAPQVGDDVGDSAGSAMAVALPGSVSAMVNSRTDKDVFSVVTAGGRLLASAYPYLPGPNLDLSLTLADARGRVVATSAPVIDVFSVKLTAGASIDVEVAAGTYTLTIDGTGNGISGTAGESDYGSVGWYTLTVDGTGGTPSPSPSATSESPTPTPSQTTLPPAPSETATPPTPTESATSEPPQPSESPTSEPPQPSEPPTSEPPQPTASPSQTSSTPTLEGSAFSTRSGWTARVTLRGKPGDATSGSWLPGGKVGACFIPANATTCSLDLTGLSKKTLSASFTDGKLGTVTMAKA